MGNSALHIAAHAGDADLTRKLVESPRFTYYGLGEHASGLTAIHVAAVQGQERVISTLLNSTPLPASAINSVTPGNGATALHLAVRHNHVAAVRMLLQSRHFRAVCTCYY